MLNNCSRMRILESALWRRVPRTRNAEKPGPQAKFVVPCSVAIGVGPGDDGADGDGDEIEEFVESGAVDAGVGQVGEKDGRWRVPGRPSWRSSLVPQDRGGGLPDRERGQDREWDRVTCSPSFGPPKRIFAGAPRRPITRAMILGTAHRLRHVQHQALPRVFVHQRQPLERATG